jgi:glycosyltransferase involved in cell wall biosynthesis
MLNNYKIVVLIPAYNEENSVGKVISELPKKIIDEVVVINNNSNDNTVVNAKKAGATVLNEINQGYGFACLKGISYLNELVVKPDIVVFLDADYSDYPEEVPKLIEPIVYDNFDMVIGSRASGNREKNSMTPQQIFGNWLATKLLKLLYNVKYTDLGPFRAIKYTKLIDLKMNDTTYGWTVEMQVKASKKNYKVCEVPVTYRKRIGHSKISGTIKGTFMAGYKIITTIFKYL